MKLCLSYLKKYATQTVLCLICATLLAGCTTYKACQEAKQMFPSTSDCPSGHYQLNVTGHAPSCADEESIKEIKAVCGWYF